VVMWMGVEIAVVVFSSVVASEVQKYFSAIFLEARDEYTSNTKQTPPKRTITKITTRSRFN
jgi:hypothetical protein